MMVAILARSGRRCILSATLCALVGIVLTLSGCVAPPTITLADADRRTLDLVREVTTVIGADPARSEETGNPIALCQSEYDMDDTGQRQVSHSFTLSGLALTDVRRTSDDVRRRVESRGFSVIDSGRYDDGGLFANYENPTDQFRLAVTIRPERASVVAGSPCVWPNGTPP